jgi:hypothetical protein
MVISTLNRDLRNTARPGLSVTPPPFLGTPDHLQFAVNNTRFAGEGPILRVEYLLAPGQAGSKRMAVHRRVLNRQGILLAERTYQSIDNLSLSYLAHGVHTPESWQSQWPEMHALPPRAVKAIIKLTDRSRPKTGHLLSTLISIPAGRVK